MPIICNHEEKSSKGRSGRLLEGLLGYARFTSGADCRDGEPMMGYEYAKRGLTERQNALLLVKIRRINAAQ
jgi:hypothetical protein